ncbi:MAG: hypothetical protein QM650_09940 [Microlunatus sp.]
MRTTLDLPDELMRTIKVRAAQEDATLTETITTLLRASLAQTRQSGARRVQFPLVLGAHRATPEELSADQVAELDAAHDLAATELSG